jgi:hypothetical protein
LDLGLTCDFAGVFRGFIFWWLGRGFDSWVCAMRRERSQGVRLGSGLQPSGFVSIGYLGRWPRLVWWRAFGADRAEGQVLFDPARRVDEIDRVVARADPVRTRKVAKINGIGRM